MPFFRTDHWRSAIVRAEIGEIAAAGTLDPFEVTLLPDIGDHRFLADPFGMFRDGRLYVFAESYDYRTLHGVIEVLVCAADGTVQARHEVLREAWHLSYPFVFEHDGEIFMLPEASASGRLSLYRAVAFPLRWERVEAFDFPHAAVDATPLCLDGTWWLFWTPPGSKDDRQSVLRVSTAGSLTGPWRHLDLEWRDRAGARPGGSPVVRGDEVWLPVQDCRGTYGRAVRWLRVAGLRQGCPVMVSGDVLEIPSALRASYPDGMHTLSGAGPYTLIDVKRVGVGPRREIMKLRRRLLGG